MKELLLRGLRYNAWANALIIELLVTLGEEVADQEVVSSFPSIRHTVLHIWGAEDIWLQRFEAKGKPVWRAFTFSGSVVELCEAWKATSNELVRFVEEQADDAAFSRIVTSVNLKGEAIADPLAVGLQHVVNHSSYHRGQLVTMLRQAGQRSIPQTDLIVYARQQT